MEARTLEDGPDLDDAALVRRAVAGDVAAFAVVVRRHNQLLYRAARAIVRDDAEAEDVVQQTWLSAYAHLGGFRGEARLSTWLCRIAVREALSRVRAAQRRRTADLHREEPMSRDPDPEDRAAGREALCLLETALDALPEAYRVVYVLRDVQELDTDETARALDLTPEAVRVRLHRARARLRAWLLDRVGGLAHEAFRFDGDRCERITARVLAVLAARA